MTDEQLALLIDPKRERVGWWGYRFDLWPNTVWRLEPSEVLDASKQPGQFVYTGPDLAADRVAAFTHVTPVLLAAGCDAWEHDKRTTVLDGHGHENTANYRWPILACITDYQSKHPYPLATTAALAWLKENAPERLRKALEEVGYG